MQILILVLLNAESYGDQTDLQWRMNDGRGAKYPYEGPMLELRGGGETLEHVVALINEVIGKRQEQS